MACRCFSVFSVGKCSCKWPLLSCYIFTSLMPWEIGTMPSPGLYWHKNLVDFQRMMANCKRSLNHLKGKLLHAIWKELLAVIMDGLTPTAKHHYVDGKIVMVTPDPVPLEEFCGLRNSEGELAQKQLQNPQYHNFTASHNTVTLMPPSHGVAGRLAANN